MNDDTRALEMADEALELDWVDEPTVVTGPPPGIPEYLQETYWWAYLHPNSFWFFEREWVVNLILWGNMRRLTNAVLEDVPSQPFSRVLQVACVYGDFSNRLAKKLEKNGSTLGIADVASIQLDNVKDKLKERRNISLHHQDSSAMTLADASYDQTVVFFLLHEQPDEVRRKTVAEAIRVTRPGGKIVFVDYHSPNRLNPLRYFMKPLLKWLEPFAMDLWNHRISDWVPTGMVAEDISNKQYFGGLYQKVVVKRV
ncbi:MAG: ubiquinone/menaquinone biosynthesis C-methylase UbiE [Lysobacterales bacterium]|jgi:ubiquinone/menaquinone biosynthesis C-methylase UbiE